MVLSAQEASVARNPVLNDANKQCVRLTYSDVRSRETRGMQRISEERYD